MEVGELFLQMLTSLRKIDGSLDIIAKILREDICKEEHRQDLMRYAESLFSTRFSLVYSMMDIRPELSKSFSENERSSGFDRSIYEFVKRKS